MSSLFLTICNDAGFLWFVGWGGGVFGQNETVDKYYLEIKYSMDYFLNP